MQRSESLIIAAAILAAGLIIAAAVYTTNSSTRYVAWAPTSVFMLDTKTGELWSSGDIQVRKWNPYLSFPEQ